MRSANKADLETISMIVVSRGQGRGSTHCLLASPPTKPEKSHPESPDPQYSIPHPDSDTDSLPYALVVVYEERREGEEGGDGKEDR